MPLGKTSWAFTPTQMPSMRQSLDDWLPRGHLTRFVAELVDVVLDLGPIHAAYIERRGSPPQIRD